jgi:hypothetical protein
VLDKTARNRRRRPEPQRDLSNVLTKEVLDELLMEIITSGEYETFGDAGQRGRHAERYRRITKHKRGSG